MFIFFPYLRTLMRFVNPAILFALAALAIPIIIHLFNFRRFKRIFFPNVRFLKNIQQETQSRSKLKHLLVLASRILALAFIVMSFAQPYIPSKDTNFIAGDKAISIYIDNSFSMDAIGKNGILFEEARRRASEIAAAHKATDRFQLLTNDFEARHQRLVSREEFLENLDLLRLSSSVKTYSEIFSRQKDVLNASGIKQKKIFAISDFQSTVCDFSEIKNDTSIRVNLVPLKAQDKNNVFIDSCWFETPVRQLNKTENLHVRVKNLSENHLENNSIRLFINGKQRTPASFSAEAGADAEVVLSFVSRETGLQNCYVEITDYPVTFDDRLFFTFEVAGNIPVLNIGRSGNDMKFGESPGYITSLFSKDSLFAFSEAKEDNIDYSQIQKQKLVILNELKTISSGLAQELKRFVTDGGSVFVFPHPESDLPGYADFFSMFNISPWEKFDTSNTRVDKIEYNQELYYEAFEKQTGNIDLPVVYGRYAQPAISRSSEETLLRLQNGSPFLSRYPVEKGIVYICSSPLESEYSNFARHAVFVPTLYNSAIFAQTRQKLFYTVGRNHSIEITGQGLTGEKVFHLVNDKDQVDVIPENRVVDSRLQVRVHDQVKEAGNYKLTDGQKLISGLAFNFDRKESGLESLDAAGLLALTEKSGLLNFKLVEAGQVNLMEKLRELDQGKKLHTWFIVLALLFLATETALLRFWKT